MICVLAIRPKFRGFKPERNDGFLRVIKIRSTPSFGGEVKPEALFRKILQHVKVTCKHEQKYFSSSSFPSPVPSACYQITLPVGLPESSGGRITSFPLSISFQHGSPWSYITWGGGGEWNARWWQ
jgi:hypothetical protein